MILNNSMAAHIHTDVQARPTWLVYMTLWDRILRKLGLRKTKRFFQLDENTVQSLRSLAKQEQRSEDDLAADLLSFALGQHETEEQNLQHWKELTVRQQEVAALICLGYTNQEIATRLSISPETVKSHIRNILGKFRLRRKSDLLRELSAWDFGAWNR